MALTKEDLQAIGQLMDIRLEPISARLNAIETEQSNTNVRLNAIETEQSNTNVRLNAIEDRQNTLESGQDAIRKDIARLNHTIEPTLKTILEGIEGLRERNRQLNRLDDKVDNHDHRIWALEQTVKA